MENWIEIRVVDLVQKYSITLDQVRRKLRSIEPGRKFRATTRVPKPTATYILANGHKVDFWPHKKDCPCHTPFDIAKKYKVDIKMVLQKVRSMLPDQRIGRTTILPNMILTYIDENHNSNTFWPKVADIKSKKPPASIIYTPTGGKVRK